MNKKELADALKKIAEALENPEERTTDKVEKDSAGYGKLTAEQAEKIANNIA